MEESQPKKLVKGTDKERPLTCEDVPIAPWHHLTWPQVGGGFFPAHAAPGRRRRGRREAGRRRSKGDSKNSGQFGKNIEYVKHGTQVINIVSMCVWMIMKLDKIMIQNMKKRKKKKHK